MNTAEPAPTNETMAAGKPLERAWDSKLDLAESLPPKDIDDLLQQSKEHEDDVATGHDAAIAETAETQSDTSNDSNVFYRVNRDSELARDGLLHLHKGVASEDRRDVLPPLDASRLMAHEHLPVPAAPQSRTLIEDVAHSIMNPGLEDRMHMLMRASFGGLFASLTFLLVVTGFAWQVVVLIFTSVLLFGSLEWFVREYNAGLAASRAEPGSLNVSEPAEASEACAETEPEAYLEGKTTAFQLGSDKLGLRDRYPSVMPGMTEPAML